MYTLMCIYIFVPAIIRFRLLVGEKCFDRISIVIFISSIISDITSSHSIQYTPDSVYRYVGFFLMGYVIYKHCNKRNKTGVFLLLVWIINVAVMSYINYLKYSGTSLPLFCNGIFLLLKVLMPLLLFYAFSFIICYAHLTWLIKLSFLIYLFHAGVRDIIIRLSNKFLGEDTVLFLFPVPLNAILLTLIVFLVSIALAYFYDGIQKNRKKVQLSQQHGRCSAEFRFKAAMYKMRSSIQLYILTLHW